MKEIFYWILNMSITGILLGTLLYFIRFIKRIPRFGVYTLWCLVLVRLTCPFSISSRFSLMNLFSERVARVVAIPDSDPQYYLSNFIQAAESYNPIVYKRSTWDVFFNIASVIWIVVAIAALISVIIMYMLSKAEMKKAVFLRDNIYESNMISTPMIYGIIHPRIILPVDVDPVDLPYIIAHEKVHIKRHDNVWRMLAVLVACIHWFNPFVWFFLRSFLNDMEIACDVGVIRNWNEDDKKKYALTLLQYARREKTVLVSGFASSRVKVRIEQIITYKKLTIISSICFIALFIGLAFVLLTNAGK